MIIDDIGFDGWDNVIAWFMCVVFFQSIIG